MTLSDDRLREFRGGLIATQAEVMDMAAEILAHRDRADASTFVYSLTRDGKQLGTHFTPLFSEFDMTDASLSIPRSKPVRATLGPWEEYDNE